MWKLAQRYHAFLVHRGQSVGAFRTFYVNLIILPWFIPIFALLFVGMLTHPSLQIDRYVLAPLCGLLFIPVMYASATFLISGLLSDYRKARARQGGG